MLFLFKDLNGIEYEVQFEINHSSADILTLIKDQTPVDLDNIKGEYVLLVDGYEVDKNNTDDYLLSDGSIVEISVLPFEYQIKGIIKKYYLKKPYKNIAIDSAFMKDLYEHGFDWKLRQHRHLVFRDMLFISSINCNIDKIRNSVDHWIFNVRTYPLLLKNLKLEMIHERRAANRKTLNLYGPEVAFEKQDELYNEWVNSKTELSFDKWYDSKSD